MLRIAIAETDDSVRRRLVQALVVEPGLEVVGTAAEPGTVLDLVWRTKPDLVLVDLGMPESGGLVLIRAILLTLPDTVVVIRQAGSDELTVHEAFRAGAGGFLVEDGFDDHITSCIRLLTPAQVQQFLPGGTRSQPSMPDAHEVQPRIHCRRRRSPRNAVPRSKRGPTGARRGKAGLLSCTAYHHHRDERGQQPWHTDDRLSHHGRRHL